MFLTATHALQIMTPAARFQLDLFADIPVESLVYEHQAEYYQALQKSTDQTDSAPFIEFMLRMILEAISTAAPQVTPQVKRLLEVMQDEMTREALQSALDLLDRLLPSPHPKQR